MSQIADAFHAVISFFARQKRIVRLLILLLPFVNWFFEVVFRWNMFYHCRKFFQLLVALVATLPFGIVLGWIDAVWTLLFKHFIFLKPKKV